MRLAAIVGPTASGKSNLAMRAAVAFGGEILSVDSMQVYREMDIGTAKPSLADRAAVRHHLVDVVDPGDDFSVAAFQRAAREAIADMEARSVPIIVCGGSGLHLRAVVDPLEFPPTDDAMRLVLEATDPADLVAELLAADPGAGDQVDLANPRRVLRAVEIHRLTGETPSVRAGTAAAADIRDYRGVFEFAGIGLDPGDRLQSRVEARLDAMLDGGWVEEASALEGRMSATAQAALGYREVAAVARGERSRAEGRDAILQATMAYAKRQRTFLRRDPRITWLPWSEDLDVLAEAAFELLEGAGWSS